jgi:transposase
MYPVKVKTVEQQDLQAMHPDWLEDAENGLSFLFRQLLQGLWGDLYALDQRMAELDKQIAVIAQEDPTADLYALDQRMAELDKQIAVIAQEDPTARRLQQLRGVGPLIATALVATVGDARQYRKGRDMAAALGLTPRQHSSGGKDRLLGISKRGDAYLRCLLVHGARSAMRTAKDKDDRLSRWIINLQTRRHSNVVAVALANKMARMAWVMMTKGVDYDSDLAAASVR